MKKCLAILLCLFMFSGEAFAAWPSVSARTKDWGNETLTDSDLEGQFDLIHTYVNAALNSSSGHSHDGTTSEGPKVPINSSLTIASQAQGDIIYASSSTVWARLGAGTSGYFLKTQGTGANPTWAAIGIPSHARDGLNVTRASSTTMSVSLGEVNINGTLVSKTSATTLTISTAGDWAGGSSLRGTSTYSYVGIDASGNIKMHTTAPSHSDYAVSVTTGKKRYATWEGTVYRVIGWFYMNSTGSGELNTYEVGNIKDGEVDNGVSNEKTSVTLDDTSYGTDMDSTLVHYYASGGLVTIYGGLTVTTSAADNDIFVQIHDGSAVTTSNRGSITGARLNGGVQTVHVERYTQGPVSLKLQGRVSANSHTVTGVIAITEG